MYTGPCAVPPCTVFYCASNSVQDGSCNGLQHYAALGRDLEGGKSVNLVPSDQPQDVYKGVAEAVQVSSFACQDKPLDKCYNATMQRPLMWIIRR